MIFTQFIFNPILGKTQKRGPGIAGRQSELSGVSVQQLGDILGRALESLKIRIETLENSAPSASQMTLDMRDLYHPGIQTAQASATLTLTNVLQDIAGATLTLNYPGRYLITGIFEFAVLGTDAAQILSGALNAATLDVASPTATFLAPTTGAQATVSQQWMIVATLGEVVKLRAKKAGGTGTSAVNITNTQISAIWMGK